MKKSKILLWSLLAVVTVLTGIGCKKFLDRKPLQATDTGLEGRTLGLYNILRTYAGFATLPWLDFNSIRDDDAQKGSSLTDGAEINTEFETFKYTKDDWATNTYYNDHYTMINQCNTIINIQSSLNLTDPQSLRNVGEAHFFRAFSFFELVKAYGEVPKLDYYFENAADGIREKSPVDSLYAVIDRDLDSASQMLPESWFNAATNSNAYPGRLTSNAAKTLWAQSYLFRKNWAKVVQLCTEVKGSGKYFLTPFFHDTFKDGVGNSGKNGPESIFEMQCYMGPNGTNSIGTDWGTSQQVRVADGFSDKTWNLGWGWNVPTQSLVSAWDSTDPRRDQTILFSGRYDGGTSQGGYGATLPPYNPGVALEQPYFNKKLYSDPAMRQLTGHVTDGNAQWINHRLLRFADVLLMLAEAANESGDGGTAETNLELVRARARGAADPSTVLPHIAFVSQDSMRNAIKAERRWEFALEGYRFYDLVRWGDAKKVLGPLGYEDKSIYYPIPQKAIDLAGGKLTQNPAWK